MAGWEIIGAGLLLLSLTGFLMVFCIYPLILTLCQKKRPEYGNKPQLPWPRVTFIVVARNAQSLVRVKIDNTLGLDYPGDRLELIFCSDGSTDATFASAKQSNDPRVMCFHTPEHCGKITALNRAVPLAKGEIVIFSDVDALFMPDALKLLVRHFESPVVGGVCGQRKIVRDQGETKAVQKQYIKFDSLIKRLESRLGWITSNDGKVYGIRKSCFSPIPHGVTDDLFVSLLVIGRGFEFRFEPRAVAKIHLPSRSLTHEFYRRRRIIAQSLWGLWMQRKMFSASRYGLYAVGLFINKVIRRFLPVCLVLMFLSSWMLRGVAWVFALFFSLQIAGYAWAALAVLLPKISLPGKIGKLTAQTSWAAAYLCCANAGMLWGIFYFITGRRVDKWNPVKDEGKK